MLSSEMYQVFLCVKLSADEGQVRLMFTFFLAGMLAPLLG